MSTIFTIGYSTRTISEFVALLRQVAVDRVVDIRASPRPAMRTPFGAEALPRSLAAAGITYAWLRDLGGPFDGGKGGLLPRNDFWQDAFLNSYADYAETAAFQEGLNELQEIALNHCCAVMREDIDWRHCCRRIVADYLIARGVTVAHIMGLNRIDMAMLTPGAQIWPDGRIAYPAGGERKNADEQQDTGAQCQAEARLRAPGGDRRHTGVG